MMVNMIESVGRNAPSDGGPYDNPCMHTKLLDHTRTYAYMLGSVGRSALSNGSPYVRTKPPDHTCTGDWVDHLSLLHRTFVNTTQQSIHAYLQCWVN